MANSNSDGKMIMAIFIGVIIVVTFMGPIADRVVGSTELQTNTNDSVTLAAVNGTITLTGRANTTAITVANITNGTADWSINFSVNTKNDAGVLGIFLKTEQAATGQAGDSAFVSYTYKPQGYIEESGGRSITLLIIIFAALAIVVFTIVQIFKSNALREIVGMNK